MQARSHGLPRSCLFLPNVILIVLRWMLSQDKRSDLSNSLLTLPDGKSWRPRANLGWCIFPLFHAKGPSHHSACNPRSCVSGCEHIPSLSKANILTLYACRTGYKQSTTRSKQDQRYDPFSRRLYGSVLDKMLGILADKLIEHGDDCTRAHACASWRSCAHVSPAPTSMHTRA